MQRRAAYHRGLATSLGGVFLCASLLLLSSAAVAPAEEAGQAEETAPAATPLDVILERAGAYAVRYGESFRNLAAEEAYRQVVAGQVRNLRSDVVFVQLPGPIPWYTFRDVYLVDGWKVKDRSDRLERLFANPSPSAHDQARSILAESSRYNLGGAQRNVNSPTIALYFLLPENQARLVFERRASRTIAGFPAVEVAFQERVRPTLVKDRWGRDVPAHGSFWIDPSRGSVLRTDIEYQVIEKSDSVSGEGETTTLTAQVLTRYRRESGLDIFVPDTMKEWYRDRNGGRIDTQARYLKYRRFQVTSDWEVAGVKDPPGEQDVPR